MRRETQRITAQLVGGLGNQLFVLAAGLLTAQRIGVDAEFDVSRIVGKHNKHSVSISSFNLPVLTVNSLTDYSKTRRFSIRLSLLVGRLFNGGKVQFPGAHPTFTAPLNGFDEDVLSVRPGTYMRGYFQSWRYHAELKMLGAWPSIDLKSPSNWYLQQQAALQQKRVLAVHVRRGDYAEQGTDWGMLHQNYYERAVKIALTNEDFDELWIFSDSVEVAKEMFVTFDELPIVHISPPTGSDAAESMILMSKAKGIVIANSTFSWWAATLGNHSFVVAPDQWFRNLPAPIDLIHPHWTCAPSVWL